MSQVKPVVVFIVSIMISYGVASEGEIKSCIEIIKPLAYRFLGNVTCMKWASTRENLSSELCEQHRRRPACASAQSDQRLCYSRFVKYNI